MKTQAGSPQSNTQQRVYESPVPSQTHQHPGYAQPYPPQSCPQPAIVNQPVNNNHNHIVVQVGGQGQSAGIPARIRRKSRLVAFLLVFMFGPIGMLYSTIGGAFFMIFIGTPAAIAFSIASGSFDVYFFSICLYWLICVTWAVSACR